MKLFRRFILLLLCFILIFLSIGFLLPKKILVKRSINIAAKKTYIFNQINTIKNWEAWSTPLFPAQIHNVSFSGAISGPGSKMTWQSHVQELSTGSISIVNSYPSDSVIFVLDYKEKGSSLLKILIINELHTIKLVLYLETHLGINPISRWIGLFSDEMIGNDLQSCLNLLKQEIEKPKSYNGFIVNELEIPAQFIVSNRDTAVVSTISEKLKQLNSRISRFVKLRNLSPAGEPFIIYHSYSASGFDIEVCLPVLSSTISSKQVTFSEKPASKVVSVKFSGNNKDISKAYQALHDYVLENGLQITGPPWEQYSQTTDEKQEVGNLTTNIFFPVK